MKYSPNKRITSQFFKSATPLDTTSRSFMVLKTCNVGLPAHIHTPTHPHKRAHTHTHNTHTGTHTQLQERNDVPLSGGLGHTRTTTLGVIRPPLSSLHSQNRGSYHVIFPKTLEPTSRYRRLYRSKVNRFEHIRKNHVELLYLFFFFLFCCFFFLLVLLRLQTYLHLLLQPSSASG